MRVFAYSLICSLILSTTVSRAQEKATSEEKVDPRRREYVGSPVMGFDSYTGLVLGLSGAIAQYKPNRFPYSWRIGLLLSVSLKWWDTDGRFSLPYHDDYLSVDVPGLLSDLLRLSGKLRFRRYTDAAWYGLGNATTISAPADAGARYFRYIRTYPNLDLASRWRLVGSAGGNHPWRIDFLGGVTLSRSTFRVAKDSKLEADRRLAAGEGRDARIMRLYLRGLDDHTLASPILGVIADNRDHEIDPTNGVYAELSGRFTPLPEDLRHAEFYGRVSGFVPLIHDCLVLAGNIMADLLAGRPPFYQLSEAGIIDSRYAPGGDRAVRGVEQQRYAGKIKLVNNIEVRGRLFRFSLGDQRFRVGLVGFFDAGRVWTDYHRVELAGRSTDGPLWRFATGIGAGARLGWGETCVVRYDFAWSPSNRTFGFYVDINHIF
jgi:hypothetical protein